jgi:WD40 repeat protein
MPACAFSHEGRLLAVQRPNRLAVVGAEQGRLRRAFPDVIVPGSALAFAPGSRFLATAAEPTGVRFWETTSWGEQPVFDPGIGSIHSLTFSPDGLLAAAGGEDGRVAVWDWG